MHSIRTKTSIFITLVLASSLALVVAGAAYYTQTSTRALFDRQIQSAVERQARLVRADLARAQATARAIAAAAESQLQSRRTDRAQLKEYLRLNLAAEPTLFGTWLVFRPDAFDGNDAAFAGTPGHDRNGMINYYYIRQGEEAVLNVYDVTTDQTEQLERDWFAVSFRSGQEAIIEPYLETFDGAQGDTSVMMTSVTRPVFDPQGNPIGVAGVDLTLAGLQSLVAPEKVAGDGEAALLSSRGIIVAHPRAALLGKDALLSGYSSDVVMAAALGQREQEVVEGPSGPELHVAEPVDFSLPGQAWSYVFRIPIATIEESSRTLWRGLTILGLALLVLAGAAGAWAGSSVARPIQTLTRIMRAIADGQLDLPVPVAKSSDEIGDMTRALAKFRDAALERAELESTMVDLKSHNRAVEILNGELRRQNARFDAALTNMSQGLCMLDPDYRVTVFNSNFLSLYGLSADVVKPGISMRDVLEHYGEITGQTPDVLEQQIASSYARLMSGRASLIHQKLDDGRIIEVSYEPMDGGGWVNTYEDVTERRKAEERIAHLARHDPLTDLPNRTLFHERLAEDLSESRQVGVLYMDLDRFKPVNDTLGHHIGDELLKAVAGRVRDAVMPDDIVARFGGDEFGVLRTGCTPGEAAELASRILNQVGMPFEIEGHQVNVGVSIGITVSDPGTDAGELLKEADLALYRAKADGRMTYRFFEPSMDAAIRERRALEMDLRLAILNNELSVHYQPIVTVNGGRIVSCEALMRWRHPVRGLVSPALFVPIAEEAGLIGQLGRWVLLRACHDARNWPSDVKVAVNFSAAQFCGCHIPDLVREAIAETGLETRRLELEITESVLIQNSESVLQVLQELNAMGVTIAMDDFGTGYSSLGYLRRFPFDKIKIDQSFIADLTRSSEAQAIVAAIVGLGTTLAMTTTAEGVETEEQLVLLKAIGCQQAQGFLFARPVPADQLSFAPSVPRPVALV
ncbi:bifunctional diguanylate cyclase/phosphodiesterase [Chthonobacter albigriseus]|uniref:bifunctional diguanylate cyclase/phosphodiesterase n=1 Tax=Chthonobacter albigriseus TaxID=1683161 RepID=UPI0015EE8D6E|nr:EAL domain-containing protein [Chthonobacter albigriseus]